MGKRKISKVAAIKEFFKDERVPDVKSKDIMAMAKSDIAGYNQIAADCADALGAELDRPAKA